MQIEVKDVEKTNLDFIEKVIRAPLVKQWSQEPALIIEKIIHPDAFLVTSGALIIAGSVLLSVAKSFRRRDILGTNKLSGILQQIEFKMYYYGCLGISTSILNLQKEMNFDPTDEASR